MLMLAQKKKSQTPEKTDVKNSNNNCEDNQHDQHATNSNDLDQKLNKIVSEYKLLLLEKKPN